MKILGLLLSTIAGSRMISEAVAVAQVAEGALLYIALPTFKEAEGYDWTNLDLTDQQVKLILGVTAVQPKQ
jgi:beta-glucosidase